MVRGSWQVLALDLSPQMIRIARKHSSWYANIDFQVADALAWEFPPMGINGVFLGITTLCGRTPFGYVEHDS